MTKPERSFEEWVHTLSKQHKQVLYKYGPIPELSQIYFILLDNIIYNKKDCNPSPLEIINWIEIGKISEQKIIAKQVKNKNTQHQKSMIVTPVQIVI